MTFDRDPPRLRTLGARLPEELARALEHSPEDEISPAELEHLARRVRAAHEESRAPVPTRKRRSLGVLFPGTLGLAIVFAIGASAGAALAAVAYFVQRAEHAHAISRARGAAPDATASVSVTPRAPANVPASRESPPIDPPLAPANAAVTAPRVHAPSASASSEAVSPRDELELLARAQSALDHDAGRALAITSDHERRFPSGALAEEREVIAIDALLRLRRRAEAVRRAQQFHRSYPTSVHGRRVDVLLGRTAP